MENDAFTVREVDQTYANNSLFFMNMHNIFMKNINFS